MALSREDILQAKDLVLKEVAVPEWGGTVFVKSMTAKERDAFEASVTEIRGGKQSVRLENIRAKFAALTICDENGKRLFDEKDIPALAEKSAGALTRVFEAAQKLSGLTDGDIKEMAEVLKKDLPADSLSV